MKKVSGYEVWREGNMLYQREDFGKGLVIWYTLDCVGGRKQIISQDSHVVGSLERMRNEREKG